MATWNVDTRYAALIPPRSQVDARVLAHRWSQISPWVLREARKTLDPAESLATFRARHAERYLTLVRANVTAKQIRAGFLDDPVPPLARFDEILAAAIQRHRERLGRVRGKGKWSKIRRSKKEPYHADST